MDLLETIDDILDQENSILPKKEITISTTTEDELFEKLVNFIIDLDPEKLYDDQIEEVLDIIHDIEDDDLEEARMPKLAKRTPSNKNQYSKKWYKKNRTKIKRRKERFRRSSQGRKRAKIKERLTRQGKTPTGRRKVRYHVRKRSDRKDREKRIKY